jgi:hypothetical protein
MMFTGCDKSGVINFSLYGDLVKSIAEVLRIDEIYEI